MAVIVGYVPTDTGFLAVTEAAREARALGVPVVIVNVVSEAGYTVPTAAEERDLEAVSTRLKEDGVDHSLRQITTNDPVADALLSVAADENAKLIVLGLHRRSRVGKMLLGSTAQSVILAAPCPVLTVPDIDA